MLKKLSGPLRLSSTFTVDQPGIARFPLAAAAGQQRWGHGHAVTTKFLVGEDSDNQLPNPPTPKIYFLLGFRPLNLENVENQKCY